MGEYILLAGKKVKLGTCTELMYVTYDDLRSAYMNGLLAQAEYNSHPEDYLNKNIPWLYRFPWLDEKPWWVGREAHYRTKLLPVVCPNGGRPLRLAYQGWRNGGWKALALCDCCHLFWHLDYCDLLAAIQERQDFNGDTFGLATVEELQLALSWYKPVEPKAIYLAPLESVRVMADLGVSLNQLHLMMKYPRLFELWTMAHDHPLNDREKRVFTRLLRL